MENFPFINTDKQTESFVALSFTACLSPAVELCSNVVVIHKRGWEQIKEKYTQLCLALRFSRINTMGFTQSLYAS